MSAPAPVGSTDAPAIVLNARWTAAPPSTHLGVLNFAWVVPALALLLVLAIVFVRFLQALPACTRWAFVVAGAIYK